MSCCLLFTPLHVQWRQQLLPAALRAPVLFLLRQAVLRGRPCNTEQLVGRSPTSPRRVCSPRARHQSSTLRLRCGSALTTPCLQQHVGCYELALVERSGLCHKQACPRDVCYCTTVVLPQLAHLR